MSRTPYSAFAEKFMDQILAIRSDLAQRWCFAFHSSYGIP